MALEQNLPGINQNDLFLNAFDWEPKMANRFIMYIGDIPSYIIKAAARPSLTNGEVVLDHINIDRKVKGKTRWNDVAITLYDPIVPSGAQAVMEWVRLHHESLTGRDGYSTQYKKDITFHSLSPTGEKIEEWTLKGAFILDTNFGQMDWGTEESVQIEMTLKYDYAVLEY
jgi:hypothetical protein|tara:strand:+ start:5945 stop:6454 length:510 start_codon:yes stop_codon:yes gene_type:complete